MREGIIILSEPNFDCIFTCVARAWAGMIDSSKKTCGRGKKNKFPSEKQNAISRESK